MNLRSLSLIGTHISDAAIKSISSLSELQSLYLDHTAVTGMGFRSTHGSWLMLDDVSLSHSLLNDQGLAWLEEMTRLRRLALNSTKVSDQGLARLGRFKGDLVELQLNGTAVTGSGLHHLAKFTALEILTLDDTALGPSAEIALAGMQSLKLLSLVNAGLSRAVVERLRAALPGCEIRSN
jgi:hypothetical protein